MSVIQTLTFFFMDLYAINQAVRDLYYLGVVDFSGLGNAIFFSRRFSIT